MTTVAALLLFDSGTTQLKFSLSKIIAINAAATALRRFQNEIFCRRVLFFDF